ncbi:MAG: hypothetical protein WAM96_19005, partial [Candidatus Acidiferrales bacterium]
MSAPDLIVRGKCVLAGAASEPAPAAIHIQNGGVTDVTGFDEIPAGCPIDDAGDRVVMPGIVDTHV